MAIEKTTQQAAIKPVSGQSVHVAAPASGAAETVTSSPAGELVLGFDPSAATASRPEGSNDLVFQLDGGGTVTIADFFVVGDESLPDLKLPDGTVVASTDFFEGSDLDMTTAAGAPAAPPSSGSDGSGDPLSMTTGVGADGTQGTWYWGNSSDTGEILEGRAQPPAGVSIIGLVPGNPDYPATPGRPDTPNLPDDPNTPGGPASYYLDASGYNLEIDESFMPGGTNFEGHSGPVAYKMPFLITVSNDSLSTVTIGGSVYTVGALEAGVPGILAKDARHLLQCQAHG